MSSAQLVKQAALTPSVGVTHRSSHRSEDLRKYVALAFSPIAIPPVDIESADLPPIVVGLSAGSCGRSSHRTRQTRSSLPPTRPVHRPPTSWCATPTSVSAAWSPSATTLARRCR